MDILLVLGASNPQMDAVEQLLRQCGVDYVYATVAGVRVTPATAGEADPISQEKWRSEYLIFGIECMPQARTGLSRKRRQYTMRCWGELSPNQYRDSDKPSLARGEDDTFPNSLVGQTIQFLASHGLLRTEWEKREGVMLGIGPGSIAHKSINGKPVAWWVSVRNEPGFGPALSPDERGWRDSPGFSDLLRIPQEWVDAGK